MPAELEEFVGGWLDLPERLRTGSGWRSARLGVDAVVGIASFQRQHRCRLRLGPVDLPAYVALLPGGERLERLSALMRLLLGDPIEWDLGLIAGCATRYRRFGSTAPAPRLDHVAREAALRDRPADDLVLRPVRAAA